MKKKIIMKWAIIAVIALGGTIYSINAYSKVLCGGCVPTTHGNGHCVTCTDGNSKCIADAWSPRCDL